jgi:hypothetical protein
MGFPNLEYERYKRLRAERERYAAGLSLGKLNRAHNLAKQLAANIEYLKRAYQQGMLDDADIDSDADQIIRSLEQLVSQTEV